MARPRKGNMALTCYCRDGVHPLSANWHAFGSLPTIMQGPSEAFSKSSNGVCMCNYRYSRPPSHRTNNVARVSSCSLPLRISKIKMVSCHFRDIPLAIISPAYFSKNIGQQFVGFEILFAVWEGCDAQLVLLSCVRCVRVWICTDICWLVSMLS